MEGHSLNQSAGRRAWEDTKQSFHTIKFFLGVEVISMGVCIFLATLLIPENASRLVSASFPAIGAVIGAMVGFGIIYLVMLVKAPYHQRDEARALLKQQGIREDTVSHFASLVNEAKDLRISKVDSSTTERELDMILKEAIIWTIKALADISARVGTIAETGIRSQNDLPLQGEIKEEDFYALFANDSNDNKINLVRRRCYDVRSWLQDYVRGLPPEFYK